LEPVCINLSCFCHHIKLRSEVKKAEKQKQFYLDELRKDSIFLDQLENDPAVKEKFAREHYLMKRDDRLQFGEQIGFVIKFF